MHRKSKRLPWLSLAELAVASAETIGHRLSLMASGRCTPAEYSRMVSEKMVAAQRTALASLRPGTTMAGLLAPWHQAARRNAARLRRRRK